jgi:glyoxylase-like metal-dependent hydrolase (beta-lactamase superfamily II)
MRKLLPPQIHVFVRDWLSANNVLLKSAQGHVLIDSGYSRHAPLTLALLATPRGLGDEPLARLVNTHCHSDHIGGNAAIHRKYGCVIAVPKGEAPLIDRWDQKRLLLDYADQRAERFNADAVLRPGESYWWGDLKWDALAAPGHDMGALVFYNREHRILISGDALWEHGFGFVMPPELDPEALPATHATIDMLGKLGIRVVIPGHGEPFTDAAAAIERARRRLAAFEEDPMRMVRYAMKALFAFVLLDRQRMRAADIPAYVERIGIFRDFNERYFRLPPNAFASWLIESVQQAGALEIDGDDLIPARRGGTAG